MTTRSEREKSLKLNEQHQVILAALLREDDNKYCADCEAKGTAPPLTCLTLSISHHRDPSTDSRVGTQRGSSL